MESQEMSKPEWASPNERLGKPCTKLQAALADLKIAEAKYRPATTVEAIELLTPGLILCAPSGMQEGERTAWCKAALMTIGDIPLAVLRRATADARKACDHPAKIVPFICKYEQDAVEWANQSLRAARAKVKNLNAPILEKHEPEYMTAEDLAEMKRELVDVWKI